MKGDLLYAARALRKNPGFAAVAILTLALGIGAATAIFSVVQGVLLSPLPYPDPTRIVQLWEVNANGSPISVADANFRDFQQRATSFSALAEMTAYPGAVTSGSEAARITRARVSRQFFDAIGVQPVTGRTFVPDEMQPGGAPAAIVGYELWQQLSGGQQRLAGQTISVDGVAHAVVGVMPPGFAFPEGSQLWVPSELEPPLPSRTAHNWRVLGRLAPGVDLSQARYQASAIARQLRLEHGESVDLTDASVVPLHEQIVGRVRPLLLMLFGAAGLLLLIACGNVVNLLLARATSRERELALRLALGANRLRLTRLFLAESLVLSLVGGALGVLIASWGVAALLRIAPSSLPRTQDIGVNGWVLAFAMLVSVVTAAGLGLAAVTRAIRAAAKSVLVGTHRTAGGTGGSRMRAGLVATQIALTAVLLVGAALLSQSFLRLMAIDPGFQTEKRTAMTIEVPAADGEMAQRAELFEEVMRRMRAIPGIERVGGINTLPLSSGDANGTFIVLSSPDELQTLMRENASFETLARDASRAGFASYRVASPDYFPTMGIRLLRGRLFDTRDVSGAPHVAVISETLAKTKWADEDPIGKVIEFGNMDGDLTPMTIVGVVSDIHDRGFDSQPTSIVYADVRQRPTKAWSFTIVAAGTAPPATVITAARQIMRSLRPDVPPTFQTLDQIVAATVAPRKFSLVLLGTFATCALLLALMGVYGVTAYGVAQRTPEIGIRMALGARGAAVERMIVGGGIRTALLGLVVGVAGALAVTRLLSSMLFGIDAGDVPTFAAVAALLLAATALAAWIPARRASRVDPAVALRSE